MSRPHPLLVEIAADRRRRWDGAQSERLLSSAREHRMAGLLWSSASSTGVADDPDLSETLMQLDLQSWARQMVLRNALGNLSRRLSKDGIDFVVLKGIPAEDRWYDRIGERPSQDIDVLVAPHHLHQVDEVIEALQPDHILVGRAQALVDSQRLPEVELWVDDVPIDLHFDFLGLGPFVRYPPAVWEEVIAHTITDGTSVLAPTPELSLVSFVIHTNRDSFRRLLGCVDVVRVLQRSRLNWATVEAYVQLEGIEALFYESLDIIQQEMGISVANNRPSRTWQSRLYHRVWQPKVRLLGDESPARFTKRQFWQPFLRRGGLGAAVRWWVRRLIPPPSLINYYQLSKGRKSTGFLRAITWERLDTRLRRRDKRIPN